MTDNNGFDEWLAQHFRQPVKTQTVAELKSDVWRQIRLRQAETPQNWLEKVLSVLLSPNYQGASLAAMLTLGIALGFTSLDNPPSDSEMTNKALGLEVFAALYTHPLYEKGKAE